MENILVKKREGYFEKFNQSKIISAVTKAMFEAEEYDSHKLDKIVDVVTNQNYVEWVDIEVLQDLIQNLISLYDLPKTHKAFVLHRNDRTEKREIGWNLDPLQQSILENKYLQNGETYDQWLDRVSGGNHKIRKLIRAKKFTFAGRILAHRGLDKKVTYSNCYVQKMPEDNLESIFDTAKELARTYSYGGGCGVDMSNLRPRGAVVNNSARETTGAVSFMGLYDKVTRLIGQNGRRGALMMSLADTHPDLPEFMNCKLNSNELTKANISIRTSNAFMEAVVEGEDWIMHFMDETTQQVYTRVLPARDLFRTNCQNNWDWAEAGMLFWDTISNWHLMSEHPEHEFDGVNPCGEEPLMSYGSCLLGSINLSEFVCHPFSNKAKFDFIKFKDAVRTSVIALNEVLDEGMDRHPLQQQKDNARDWRQIGLGVMGIADMLLKLGIKYGDEASLIQCGTIAHTMIDTAIHQSALLAKDKGAFPMYDKEVLERSNFYILNTTADTKKVVEQYGLHNSQLLTIAPTGTISTMWGISGGIEPIYGISYSRKTESLHGEEVTYQIITPIIQELMKAQDITDLKDLPDYVVTAHDIYWKDRVDMQAVWQNRIDASISSTVNLTNDVSVEEVEHLFIHAWGMGCKGLTIFRDGCKRAGILNTTTTEEEPTEAVEHVSNAYEDDIKYTRCVECGESIQLITNGCAICQNCGSSPCS